MRDSSQTSVDAVHGSHGSPTHIDLLIPVEGTEVQPEVVEDAPTEVARDEVNANQMADRENAAEVVEVEEDGQVQPRSVHLPQLRVALRFLQQE